MGQPDIEVEALALGARLLASLGDAPGARARAERAAARCKETRLQSYSEVAWNLAATYALIGDDSVACLLYTSRCHPVRCRCSRGRPGVTLDSDRRHDSLAGTCGNVRR